MVWACAHQRMVNRRFSQKRMMVEKKKKNLLSIGGLNKKKLKQLVSYYAKLLKNGYLRNDIENICDI
jgi:hypothetical protein